MVPCQKFSSQKPVKVEVELSTGCKQGISAFGKDPVVTSVNLLVLFDIALSAHHISYTNFILCVQYKLCLPNLLLSLPKSPSLAFKVSLKAAPPLPFLPSLQPKDTSLLFWQISYQNGQSTIVVALWWVSLSAHQTASSLKAKALSNTSFGSASRQWVPCLEGVLSQYPLVGFMSPTRIKGPAQKLLILMRTLSSGKPCWKISRLYWP